LIYQNRLIKLIQEKRKKKYREGFPQIQKTRHEYGEMEFSRPQ
jgi:predicted DNA-binding WGR domain protein